MSLLGNNNLLYHRQGLCIVFPFHLFQWKSSKLVFCRHSGMTHDFLWTCSTISFQFFFKINMYDIKMLNIYFNVLLYYYIVLHVDHLFKSYLMTRTESCFNFKNVEFGRITCFFYFTFTFKESVILNFREIIPPQQSFI